MICMSAILSLSYAFRVLLGEKRVSETDAWEFAARIAAPILQAGSIVLTSIFAVRGLTAWRDQLIGKRKFEVAEEALMTFALAKEALRAVRAPISWSDEGLELMKQTGVASGDYMKYQAHYAILQRLRTHSERFAKLATVKITAGIHLEPEAETAIDLFLEQRWKVWAAVDELIDATRDNYLDKIDTSKLRKTIYARPNDDFIQSAVDEAEAKIKAVCVRYLK